MRTYEVWRHVPPPPRALRWTPIPILGSAKHARPLFHLSVTQYGEESKIIRSWGCRSKCVLFITLSPHTCVGRWRKGRSKGRAEAWATARISLYPPPPLRDLREQEASLIQFPSIVRHDSSALPTDFSAITFVSLL